MTVDAAITSEIQKLEPSAIIELFELDGTSFGGDVFRFHAGTNGLRQNVVWQGNTYTAFPAQASGFDMSGNGQLPRPKLVMANVTGAITLLVLEYDDLLGAKVTRRRTMAKFLDAVNFPVQRNQLLRTEEFNNSYWAKSNQTISANVAVAPDWATTADKLIATSVLTTHYVYRQTALTSGQDYRWSMYAKADESSLICLWHSATGGAFNSNRGASFDLVNGVVYGTTGSVSPTITDVGNGWFRISILMTATASATATFGFGSHSPSNLGGYIGSFAGDDVSGVLVWGAQLDVGSSVTDYQPVGATFQQNPTADTTAEFPNDIFFIDRKVTETRDIVEFELAAAFDVAGIQLPRRQIIQNVCTWRYRGTECGYTGTSYFDANDVAVGSVGLDVCGKRLSSCKKRFGTNNPLPFGSFPAAGLTR